MIALRFLGIPLFGVVRRPDFSRRKKVFVSHVNLSPFLDHLLKISQTLAGPVSKVDELK